MKILIATDVILIRDKGHYYLSSAFGSILKRYFENFGKVLLCSRVQNTPPPDKYFRVDEYIEEVIPTSLKNALLKKDKSIIKEAISKADLVIGRCPSLIAYNALTLARKMKKSTYAEVVADPWDSYWNHSLKGKILAPYMFFAARKNIKKADYALYVTNEFLQKRYPCKNKTIGLSDVKIDTIDESVLQERLKKIKSRNLKEITLVTTAAVNVKYKGQQYVIKAIPKLNKLGISVKYILIGGGDQTCLKNLAQRKHVLNQVEFTGLLSPEEVLRNIDNADIYIQPSLQEGLPRSVVEAMSRACPCLGAKTGGIPELLPHECIFKRKSHKDITKKIQWLYTFEEMPRISTVNFNKAKDFQNVILSDKRIKHYKMVKEHMCSYD